MDCTQITYYTYVEIVSSSVEGSDCPIARTIVWSLCCHCVSLSTAHGAPLLSADVKDHTFAPTSWLSDGILWIWASRASFQLSSFGAIVFKKFSIIQALSVHKPGMGLPYNTHGNTEATPPLLGVHFTRAPHVNPIF